MAVHIDNEQVRELLPMDECIQAMEDAFRHEGEGLGGSLVRQTLFFPGGRQRLMIGSSPGFDTYGFKTYGGGVNLVLVFSVSDNQLQAIMESRVLSEIRTGAVAGLATKPHGQGGRERHRHHRQRAAGEGAGGGHLLGAAHHQGEGVPRARRPTATASRRSCGMTWGWTPWPSRRGRSASAAPTSS